MQGLEIADTSLPWAFTGLLLMAALICWAAGKGMIAANGWVHIPVLILSDSAWRAGNAAAVLPACIAFGVALVCSVVGLFEPPADWGPYVALIGGGVWMLIAAVRAAAKNA
jgi:hypothetical protein